MFLKSSLLSRNPLSDEQEEGGKKKERGGKKKEGGGETKKGTFKLCILVQETDLAEL